MAQAATQTTFIILASDGRHVSLSRHAEPTDAELDASSKELARLGLTGWLVRMDGRYHSQSKVTLTVLRHINGEQANLDAALAVFHTNRAAR